MSSRIVFVHIVACSTVAYSHGIASLSAVLKDQGWSPEAITLVVVRDNEAWRWALEISRLDPLIVLFSLMSNQWNLGREIATALKELRPEVPLCIGGSHAISSPSCAADSPFDVAWGHEGEAIIGRLISAAPLGLAKFKSVLRDVPVDERYVGDMNRLPLPDLSVFPIDDILEYPSVMFSRGCPYKCTYCLSRKGGPFGRVRWKAPSRAVAEVEQLCDHASVDEVYIDDDTLLKNPKWVAEFCALYRDRVSLPFYCNARPETVSYELARMLSDAGCKAIGIGIESGSHRIRRDVLLREMSEERIIASFEAARRAGLKTWSFNMVGVPTETADDLRATIALNEIAKPDFVRVSVFTAYPGTPLGVGAEQTSGLHGYFNKGDDLPKSLRTIYADWIHRLNQEGRLWVTGSEAKTLA